jgi:FtsX-like permease family
MRNRTGADLRLWTAFNVLFLGLGAAALLVGAVGVANIMVISVLERRSEIGLRPALGATKGHIRIQFLSEAILVALAGGAAGIILGAAATAIYAHAKDWTIVIPAVGSHVTPDQPEPGRLARRGLVHQGADLVTACQQAGNDRRSEQAGRAGHQDTRHLDHLREETLQYGSVA